MTIHPAPGRHHEVILFDLDGTLTDPAVGITTGIQRALASLGIIEADQGRLRSFIGPPMLESFQRAYALSRAEAMRAVEVYRDYYGTVGLHENHVYPGIPALLAALRDQGRVMIVATAKATVFAERILDTFELLPSFDLVVGSNLDYTRTTKAEVIAHILAERPAARNRHAVMIGDREHDVLGARQHGLDSIAVSYGFGSPAELHAAQPTHLVASVTALADLLGAPG